MGLQKTEAVNNVNPNTYYDFYKEKFFTNIFGFYIIFNKPIFLYILHRLFMIIVAFLYSYGVSSGIYTIIYVARNKSEQVQAFYAMGLMGVSIGFHVTKYGTNDSLNSAIKHIRRGVYEYNELFQEDLIQIKLQRIKRIRFLVGFVGKGMYFCSFTNTIIPLIQLILSGFDSVKDEILNPFIPLHLYVPFETKNLQGYCLAYISNALIMFTMYATFAAHAQLYISCSLQLTLELEILNHALRNVEKRAFLRYGRKNLDFNKTSSVSMVYNDSSYQNCLYLCLRESILHHHAILRFRDTITPYIQTTVSVVFLFFSFLMAAGILIILENSRPQLTLLTDLFGFLPLCWVGQQVMNESGETKNALFDTPWSDCNQKFKVLLNVFMSNVQKPILLRASAIDIKLCLETFGDMVTFGYKITNVMR